MNILFIFESINYKIGGAEKLFYQIIQFFYKKNYKINIITSNYKKNSLKNNINIKRIKSKRSTFFLKAVFSNIYKHRNTDIIITSTYSSCFIAYLFKLLYKKKVIIIIHDVLLDKYKNMYIPFYKKIFYFCIEKIILYLKFDHYIAVSNHTSSQLIKNKIPKNKISIIKNSIEKKDVKTQKNKIKKTKYISFLYYGRYSPIKGLENFLYALYKDGFYKKLDKKIRFYFQIKSISYFSYKNIEKIIKKYNLENIVKLVKNSSKPNLVKRIKSSDFIIYPSLSEGFGYAILESGFLNKKLIVSNKGAIPENVFGNVSFFNPKEYETIQKSILNALDNKFEYIKPKHFSKEKMLFQYEQLINNINYG